MFGTLALVVKWLQMGVIAAEGVKALATAVRAGTEVVRDADGQAVTGDQLEAIAARVMEKGYDVGDGAVGRLSGWFGPQS